MPSIQALPWPELLRALEEPMLGFARKIAQSPHAAKLHAYPCGRSLALATTREIKPDQERLIVCASDGRFHLAYTDWGAWDVDGPRPTVRGQDSWVRDYGPDEIWPAFLKFLRRVGWVPDADAP
jgi:hypothetical protein